MLCYLDNLQQERRYKMDLDKTLTIEQGQEPIEEVVSTEEVQTETKPEWVAPTQEEFKEALKSASNKAKTEILKSLGVTSIKEFKQKEAQLGDLKSQFDNFTKENEEVKSQLEQLKTEYNDLLTTSTLNEMKVKDEYRNDIIKIASDMITETKPFSEAVKELVTGRYKYVTEGQTVKMGTEKTPGIQISDTDQKIRNKYPFIK